MGKSLFPFVVQIGTRLELLDRLYSYQVRPARVIEQLGRRICVQVSQADVDKEIWDSAKKEKDAQVGLFSISK